MLKIGSVIDGKYKILNIAGKGGMSVVYLAINEKANKQWAIKEIRGQDYRDFEIDKQEIEMMKRLKHPGLPAIVDVIEQKNSLLIVMDYIEGRSLEEMVLEYGPMKETEVLDYAKQICEVLNYLHAQCPPIIYRDMKPANVMLKPDGTICLIDFGAAREYKPENRKDTVLLGTKGYAAPEQYRFDDQSDARTDIYSLGITLFRLLTGETPEGLCQIQQLRPDISPGLSHIVMKCLHVSKEERYQNAEEMLDDLGHYWEYDREFQKEQRKKAWLFGLALLACLAFGITAIICTLLENSTRKHNYMSYLQMAGNSQTMEEAVENYRKAIVLDPAREEAYQKLLKNCFLEDGEFSREESEVFRRIFIEYGKNGERNERALQKNASGYGNLCYEVGIAYFYKYEERNNKKYAGSYFEAAINTNCLTEQKNLRAKRLAVISDYYSKIGRIDEAGDVFVGYREYWLDLCAVSEGNIVQQDNERTALVMYEEIVSQIISNAVHFRNDNVTREEVELQMEKIETHLKEDFKKSDEIIMAMLRQELDALRENIQRAKQVIASVYEEAE